ncbi:hypothetical protein EDD16DRAFT_1525350 [Pisolithus croceorrhizus]|nr:hypothetical protein EDD16DRAFT_1525350 [Pisolithus croceorrhizus]KAI6129065.1 hypothetical protein EV401DRAFT_1884967 [Pisolithus croceorrhizus]
MLMPEKPVTANRYAQPRTSGASGTRDNRRATCSARAVSKATRLPWEFPTHQHSIQGAISKSTSGSDDGMSSLIIISETWFGIKPSGVPSPVYGQRENVFIVVLCYGKAVVFSFKRKNELQATRTDTSSLRACTCSSSSPHVQIDRVASIPTIFQWLRLNGQL